MPRFPLLVTAVVIATEACAGSSSQRDQSVPFDGGVADAVALPDLGVNADSSLLNGIGTSCDPETGYGCSSDTVCLVVGGGVGACARPGCSLEDTKTPIREDSCPVETACAKLTIAQAGQEPLLGNYCLPTCTPRPNDNACNRINGKLACDPATVLYTGYTEVCLLPTCYKDSDCGNRSDIDPDSICDLLTGTCFVRGDINASIGKPCQVSKECGPKQFCLAEQKDAQGKTRVAGGYCTVVGCRHAGLWQCPSKSRCVSIGSEEAVSLCLSMGCNPKADPKKDGCRDEIQSAAYQCVAVGMDSVCWPDFVF